MTYTAMSSHSVTALVLSMSMGFNMLESIAKFQRLDSVTPRETLSALTAVGAKTIMRTNHQVPATVAITLKGPIVNSIEELSLNVLWIARTEENVCLASSRSFRVTRISCSNSGTVIRTISIVNALLGFKEPNAKLRVRGVVSTTVSTEASV
jgi:hypothetical protein